MSFDEAQGSQRSILMMDITASEKLGFLKSTNRIVVGISRACDGILIVRNGDGLVFRPKIVKMRKRVPSTWKYCKNNDSWFEARE
jgi:hypothetical protein